MRAGRHASASGRRGRRPVSRPRRSAADPAEVCVRVCATCRAEGEPVEPRERAGARLLAALSAAREDDPEVVVGRMLQRLQAPLHRGFSAPGAGPMSTATSPPTSPPKFSPPQALRPRRRSIPWKERPEALKRASSPACRRGAFAHDRLRQDSRHHRHRLPRRRQDHADPPSAGERRRPAARTRSSTSSAMSASMARS